MRDMPLVRAAEVLLSRSRLVFGYPLALAVLAAAGTYLMHPRYVASVAFAPERLSSSGVPAGLSRLAAQFGITLTEPTRSPSGGRAVRRTPWRSSRCWGSKGAPTRRAWPWG